MANYLTDFKINNVRELGNFFITCGKSDDFIIGGTSVKNSCFVSVEIRNDWILNHQKVTVNGRVYNVTFKNIGDGVYHAALETNKH